MEGPLEQVLEHPKSLDFIDVTTSAVVSLILIPSLVLKAFGIPSIHPSPRLSFPLRTLLLPWLSTPMAGPRTRPALPVVLTLPLTVSIPLL